MEMPEWMKPGLAGVGIGAVGMLIVGLGAGWMVTSGSAQEQAQSAADKAVVAALTPICVAEFKGLAKSQKSTHVAALKDASSWDRESYVEDQGWATFAGSEDPNDDVAEACAEKLVEASQA